MDTPTVEDLLRQTSIGFNLHLWAAEGGSIQVTTEELRPMLENAYDPNMTAWPSLISWDEEHGWHVA